MRACDVARGGKEVLGSHGDDIDDEPKSRKAKPLFGALQEIRQQSSDAGTVDDFISLLLATCMTAAAFAFLFWEYAMAFTGAKSRDDRELGVRHFGAPKVAPWDL